MAAIYIALGAIAAIAGLVCLIIILIDMFQDSIVKGLLGLLCGLYTLYYGLIEFEHDNKWLIVIMAFGGTAIASGLFSMAARA